MSFFEHDLVLQRRRVPPSCPSISTPAPVAKRLQAWKWMEKLYPPSSLCTRQLPRTRKIGCLSRLAIRPQQLMSWMPSFGQFRVIVPLVPVILSTAPVCVTRSNTVTVAKPIVWSLLRHNRGMCDTASNWGCVCNDTFGGPNCNVQCCPHCAVLERKRRPRL